MEDQGLSCGSLDNVEVIVLDFGGQYAHLIARRLRELGVLTLHVPVDKLRPEDLDMVISGSKGVVLSGGPSSVWEKKHDRIVSILIRRKTNLLGICYGHQLLAHVLGGRVDKSPKPEFGPTRIRIVEKNQLLEDIPSIINVWMSHNDAVAEPPKGAKVLAVSEGSPVAAMKYEYNGVFLYGVQWHPEVVHSEFGMKLFENWIKSINATRSWTPNIIYKCVLDYTMKQVSLIDNDKKIVAAISGGIDSSVAAAIVSKIASDRLIGVLIDHGLHPEGELENALRAYKKLGLVIDLVDASEEFLNALRGVNDAEEKRRIISELYFKILKEKIYDYNAGALVQGTIYPDLIESGFVPGSARIKSHHNVIFRELLGDLLIVEPLKWLYKDEVRRLGEMLGLDMKLVYKKPVPGPGLAVRVEGEVTREKLEIVRKADYIVRGIIEKYGLDRDLWQYFAVLTRSMATGVKGDNRAYGYVIAVRIVESKDAMTARPARLPWEVLEEIALEITSRIDRVVRVVYDITSKPPATIEWE